MLVTPVRPTLLGRRLPGLGEGVVVKESVQGTQTKAAREAVGAEVDNCPHIRCPRFSTGCDRQ